MKVCGGQDFKDTYMKYKIVVRVIFLFHCVSIFDMQCAQQPHFLPHVQNWYQKNTVITQAFLGGFAVGVAAMLGYKYCVSGNVRSRVSGKVHRGTRAADESDDEDVVLLQTPLWKNIQQERERLRTEKQQKMVEQARLRSRHDAARNVLTNARSTSAPSPKTQTIITLADQRDSYLAELQKLGLGHPEITSKVRPGERWRPPLPARPHEHEFEERSRERGVAISIPIERVRASSEIAWELVERARKSAEPRSPKSDAIILFADQRESYLHELQTFGLYKDEILRRRASSVVSRASVASQGSVESMQS